MLILRRIIAAVAFALCASARGQGGPPMITDDPGTPGNGRVELNLAVAFSRVPRETSWDAPAIDLNYGVGERIQLTLQTAPVVLKRRGRGAIGGLGGTEAAVKWRFLDEASDGISMSAFPRVIFNLLPSSVRRGLADDGTRVQLPFQVAKKFGPIALDCEYGPLLATVGRSEWLYGIVAGTDVTKTTEVMAELHGTARTNFSDDALTLNLGLRQKLNDTCVLITSLGHAVRSPQSEPLALVGYCGVQLLF